MIRAARHTGIVVQDMERCLHFWRDLMGLEVVADFWETGAFIAKVQGLPDVRLRMIKLRAPDGSMVELLKDEAHPTPPPATNRLCDRGLRHIAFTVSSAAQSWRILRDSGCDILSDPVEAPDGKAKVFFARDPEGNLLEIVEVMSP